MRKNTVEMSFFSSYPLYLETPLQQTELQLGRPMSVSATAGAGGVTEPLVHKDVFTGDGAATSGFAVRLWKWRIAEQVLDLRSCFGVEADLSLLPDGGLVLASVPFRVGVACCYTRFPAGPSGRLWPVETACLATSLRASHYGSLSSLTSGSREVWRHTDMVVAMKSTRFLHCPWRNSGVYSLVSCCSSRSSSEASYANGDSEIPGIRGNEENLTFSGSSPMVENIV
ncbi:hypothetical protein YC2023_019034 [Brassica napus]